MAAKATVICLLDRRNNSLCRRVRANGFEVIEVFAPDKAVALSVSREVSAVVMDEMFCVVREGWSIAQSLKLVRPAMCILLLTNSRFNKARTPSGIDAMVPRSQPAQVIACLMKMTSAA